VREVNLCYPDSRAAMLCAQLATRLSKKVISNWCPLARNAEEDTHEEGLFSVELPVGEVVCAANIDRKDGDQAMAAFEAACWIRPLGKNLVALLLFSMN
jgi:hypothetical protein